MKRFMLVALIATAFAQLDPPRHNKGYVTMDAPPAITVAPGKSARVAVRFRVNPGYHVNSHTPGSELFIPTTLDFKPLEKIKVGKISYPAGEELALEFSPKDKLSVYSGDIAMQVPVIAAKDAASGQYSLKGELKYQACNNNSCFPPKSLPVEINVNVKK